MTTKGLKIKKVPTKVGISKKVETKIIKVPKTKIPKVSLPIPARLAGRRRAGLKKEKLARTGGEDTKVVLRIRVRAYESKILDSSVKQIIDTAMRYDAEIVGPVPLPTEIKKYTVNRASFIYKNTREQFEIRVHKRLIDIINPNPKTVEALTNLSLPSGVDIDVKML